MSRKNRVAIAAIVLLAFCATLFSACGGKQEKPKQNSYVVKDLPDWVKIPESANKYVESVDLYDEDSAGSEYWKVRVCSAEEQAKGNMFETDYFIFGEPIDKSGDYALKIKEGVSLPKNLYLGWLYVFEFTGGNETVYNYPTVGYYIPEGVFENRTEIETVSLPQRMGTTAKRAFANCINLKKVYLRVWETWLNSEDPPIFTGVRGYDYYIAGQMFLNCVALEEVTFTGDCFDAKGKARSKATGEFVSRVVVLCSF